MAPRRSRRCESVAGTLKLDLAQFRELEAFATFGSELDAVSKAQLERGYRLVELLKQPLNSPMPVEEQVISIYAGTAGVLDDLPVDEVTRFETELLEYFRTRHAGLLAEIRDTGAAARGRRARRRGRRRSRRGSSPTRRRRDRRGPRRPPAENPEDRRRVGLAMAGGQERILRRRIQSVQSTKKITRAMELIAASRIVKAQARVDGGAAVQRAITEVVRDLAAGRRRRSSPLLSRATRSARSRTS